MKLHGFVCRTLALATLGLPFTVGCGSSSNSANTTAAKTDGAQTATAGSSAATTNSATVITDGSETEPAQSVAIFLDSLRKGDERAANGVLTAKAREELAKTAYVIQPLGTPEGQYQIGRVGFPYADKNIALVECTWTEPPIDGEAQEVMDIVCEVHADEEGWRISGIGVSIPGTDQALVLDFEDAASLQATIDAATGQTTQQPTGQVANTQANSGQPQMNLPSFPAGGADASQTTTTPSFPQIALPPVDGAPINR